MLNLLSKGIVAIFSIKLNIYVQKFGVTYTVSNDV